MTLTKEPVESIVEIVDGDTFTPISLYQKLTGKNKFLLESAFKHQDSGRYSFIGADPIFELIGKGKSGKIVYADGIQRQFSGNPLLKVNELIQKQNHLLAELNIPFIGGGIGYVGYDIVRQYEDIGVELPDRIGMPDIHLMFYEAFIAFDHLLQRIYLIGTPLTKESTIENIQKRIDAIKGDITSAKGYVHVPSMEFSPFISETPKNQFIEKVKKAKEYIQKGDIFQVVLSQRMKAHFKGNPFDYYRKLRLQNPSPYMYCIDFGKSFVVGTSPESLIQVNGEKVITNPIAGTKPRGKTEAEDREIERSLLQDEKELAEHKMLVDLGRNDLGKVCEFGSIKLEKYMAVERYKHVMHIVSEVSGVLKKTYSSLDTLVSCLPAGTVSGAPKIRAMEIINELEPSKRGVYSGAVGYYSANGNIDFALTIRTMLFHGDTAYIQAGAGIVYDSIPEQEYQETLNKLGAFLEGNRHDTSN